MTMRKTIIQIYEIQTETEAEALVALGVDNIGSVILSVEKWKVPAIRKAVQKVAQMKAKSVLIPLFGDPATIFNALEYYQPDIIHFCEAPAILSDDKVGSLREFDSLLSLQRSIKDRFPQIEIMRSLPVPQQADTRGKEVTQTILSFGKLLAPLSDYFLIDTVISDQGALQAQPVAGFVGITGEVCDWSIAGAIINWSPIPVILAGGISDENVYDAIIRLKPAGVDSCTKTNAVSNDGSSIRFQKDLKKVKRMVEEARRADALLFETL